MKKHNAFFAPLRLEERFESVKRTLLSDEFWWLLRLWCKRWNLPPNDPRVLDFPLSHMEDWLVADQLEAWAEGEPGRKLSEANYKEVFPHAASTFEEIYESTEAEMGGPEKADPEEVEVEARRRYEKFLKERSHDG